MWVPSASIGGAGSQRYKPHVDDTAQSHRQTDRRGERKLHPLWGTSHTPAECRLKSAVSYACKKRGHLASSRGRAGYRPPRQTHTVDQDPEGEESETEDTHCLFNIRTKQKPITVNIVADGKNLGMDLDTGAAVSVMSEQTYHSLWPKGGPSLQPTTINLRTYTGEPIRVKGSISLMVEHNHQKLTLPKVVVEGSGPILFGQDWLKDIHLDWLTSSSGHKAVFQYDLGGLRGTTAKMYGKHTQSHTGSRLE